MSSPKQTRPQRAAARLSQQKTKACLQPLIRKKRAPAKSNEKADFWAFVRHVDWDGSGKKRSTASRLAHIKSRFNAKQMRQFIDEFGKLRAVYQKALFQCRGMDTGGGDDWTDIDLFDAIVVRGKTFFYNMIKTPRKIGPFGRKMMRTGAVREGFYVVFQDLEDHLEN